MTDMKAYMQTRMKKEQADLLANYHYLNTLAQKGQILFTGSSLMEQFPINELARAHGFEKIVYNRGIGGFETSDFLANLDTQVFDLEPSTIFINIGTNDLHLFEDGRTWQEVLTDNYNQILQIIKKKLPKTKVYVMAYYPMDEGNQQIRQFAKELGLVRSNQALVEASDIAKELAKQHGFDFINLNQGLLDETGNLKSAYTKDGVHLYAEAYDVIYNNLRPYL